MSFSRSNPTFHNHHHHNNDNKSNVTNNQQHFPPYLQNISNFQHQQHAVDELPPKLHSIPINSNLSNSTTHEQNIQQQQQQQHLNHHIITSPSFTSHGPFKSLVTHDPFFYERVIVPPIPPSLSVLSDTLGPPATLSLPKDPHFKKMASVLDLTRITNRIIASGLPWKKKTERASHRNNIDDLSKFLDTRFDKKYMIWNLAGDTAIGDYDPLPFHNQIASFALSKAYQMSIKTFFDICRSIHAWLSLDIANVAVIHCTNGCYFYLKHI